LSDEAKTVFIKTGNLVLGLGLNPDSEALTRYAENTVIIRRAHRELLDEPMFVIAANGSCAPHPAIRMAREFEPLVVKFESENGLSAASRARLGIQVGPSVAEEPSPTSKYLT
jgi:P27 family predicted phage terminase small subunit